MAELVDPKTTTDLYKGLKFPAADIPPRARDLYKTTRVRLLYDRDQETSRLVCRTKKLVRTPLDMTYAYLRAMSPVHLKYLKNMAVKAFMSISLNVSNELWGLIACHSYGSQGMRVSFPLRKICQIISVTASRAIERLATESRLKARMLLNSLRLDGDFMDYISTSANKLLSIFKATARALSVNGNVKVLGDDVNYKAVQGAANYVSERAGAFFRASQDIRGDFPGIEQVGNL